MRDWAIATVIIVGVMMALLTILCIVERDWHNTVSLLVATTIWILLNVPAYLMSGYAMECICMALMEILSMLALMVCAHSRYHTENAPLRRRYTLMMTSVLIPLAFCVVYGYYLTWGIYHGKF